MPAPSTRSSRGGAEALVVAGLGSMAVAGGVRYRGMEQVGSDRVVVAAGNRVIVLSRADMPGWEVRAFRRGAILFRGSHYFVAIKEPHPGGFRYTLEPWPPDSHDIDGGVIEYDEHFVAARDAGRRTRAAASGVRALLLPLYPLIGLLPGSVKRRLADGFGISEELSTVMSLWLEFLVAAGLAALFTIRSMAGLYGSALGVRGPIPWLASLTGFAAGGLLLIVPDLLMRYSKILAESQYPWGFWEWLFRRER